MTDSARSPMPILMSVTSHPNTPGLPRRLQSLIDRIGTQRLINWSMAVAVVTVLLRFVLLAVPEVVPFGEELGVLLSGVALAFVTGWIFHLLVIVHPERERLVRSNRLVAPRVFDLARPALQLVDHLTSTTDRPEVTWPPSQQELAAMCAKVDPSANPKKYLGTWWQYLSYTQRRREDAQLRLEPYYDRIEEDLLALIASERDAGAYLKQFRPGLPLPSNETLEVLAPTLYSWAQASDALLTHANTVLDPGHYVTGDDRGTAA